MTTREKIDKMSNILQKSDAQISKELGVSRQRVHQVRKNYITIDPKSKLREILNLPCGNCGEVAQNIHHIDGNSRNNLPNNLIQLCIACHRLMHKKTKPKKKIKTKKSIKEIYIKKYSVAKYWATHCVWCNKRLNILNKAEMQGNCRKCYENIK